MFFFYVPVAGGISSSLKYSIDIHIEFFVVGVVQNLSEAR